MTLQTRQPTGKPSWPLLLLAGAEKAGKTYAAAEASASELIGRTLWVGVGEDDPDEYGALPGARFEIVQHDGTYRSILRALLEAAQEPADGPPNLIVLDSATRMWDLLCDEQQVVANDRAARKAAQSNRPAPDEDATITMDQWNTAKQRWAHIIDSLRDHQGPSIVTARLEQVTVLDSQGKPTAEKAWKVKAEKSLPYDVGAIVEMPIRGEAYLTGVRSLRFRADPVERVAYDGFTVEKLWTDLGLAEPDATSPRWHSSLDPRDLDPLALVKAEVWAEAQKHGIKDAQTLAAHFAEVTGGALAGADEQGLRGYLETLKGMA
jgi:hypothetical protein